MLVVEPTPIYHREYLVRLPLPLAQLYIRCYNAKEPRSRHDNSFYLFECLIKLAACPLVAAYVHELRDGTKHQKQLDRLLSQLALPSLGQWLGILRETSRFFAERSDAATHPMGHVFEQLTVKRDDTPGALNLFREIKNGPDGKRSGDKRVSLIDLFTALVQYRNVVFGHGASRDESFYEDVMGPLLFPAVNDVLQAGWLDMLGPPDSTLVFVREIRRIDADTFSIDCHSLVGVHGERMQPLQLSVADAQDVVPNTVYLYWTSNNRLLPIEPLVAFREGGLSEELLFLNRDRNAKQVEFLSYTTGRTERDKSTAETMQRLLATITGDDVNGNKFSELIEQSRKADPAMSSGKSKSHKTTDDSEADSESRLQIGDFEVLADIGTGGMGIVYLARQLSLGRVVALKMLPAVATNEESSRIRFEREVKALAQCEHPNIVKVIASGTTPAGQMYYAMEFVTGADLEETWQALAGLCADEDVSTLGSDELMGAVIAASEENRAEAHLQVFSDELGGDVSESTAARLTLSRFNMPRIPDLHDLIEEEKDFERRVVMIIRDVARALQILHDNNIVHRDVKPANLVLTADGKRVVLMDFGLAKCGSLSGLDQTNVGFQGTLRYAAPEQLATGVPVGPQADVRGLGVTMWELLTRKRLFDDAADDTQLAAAVYQKDVPMLRSIDIGFESDLEAIVARATEREVGDRIQTAGELANYLDSFLNNEPIDLRIPDPMERTKRWFRRHTLALPLAIVASFACVATVVAVWTYQQRLASEQNEAITLETPFGLPIASMPHNNPLTRSRINLGKLLFFDKRLSADYSISCADCHDPRTGYSTDQDGYDNTVRDCFSDDREVYEVARNAPTIMNVSYVDKLFWDGRAESLETHALEPIKNEFEMKMNDNKSIIERLKSMDEYVELFEIAFPPTKDESKDHHALTPINVAKAIAAFERTLMAGNSPFDRYLAMLEDSGDVDSKFKANPLSKNGQKGYDIFKARACDLCHEGKLLTDGQFYNAGIIDSTTERDPGAFIQVPQKGRKKIPKYSFRTPTLRDLNRTAPYMHDGSLATLEHVILYHKYDNEGNHVPVPRDEAFKSVTAKDLSDEDRWLKEFLEIGLASEEYPVIESPFPADFKWHEDKGIPKF